MKSKIMGTSIIAIALAIVFPFSAMSQEKEKTVTVKTVKIENGKKIVKDTTFTVKESEDIDAIVKPISWARVADSGKLMTIDVETNGSDRSDVEKLIIYKNDAGKHVKLIEGEGGNVFVIKKGGGGDCNENVFFTPGHGQKRVMRWNDGDSLEYEFELQGEMKDFQRELEMQQFELQKMQKNLQEELAEIEGLNEEQIAEIMEEINDMDFHFVMPPARPKPPKKWKGNDFEFYFDSPKEGGVSDIELRDANIKNKPDRLDLDEVDIKIENNVVDISFQILGEASPSVVVYNVYGDKIFSGKPVLLNGKFEIKIDLSQKQHGTYYWQIVDKNRSFTDKIRI